MKTVIHIYGCGWCDYSTHSLLNLDDHMIKWHNFNTNTWSAELNQLIIEEEPC